MPRQARKESGTGIYHMRLRGINRQDIFEDAEAGLPAPEYKQNEFMVYATIRQHGNVVTTEKTTEKDEGVNGV